MAPVNVQQYEKRLHDRLAELGERLEEIEDDLEEKADDDFEERAIERENDEVLENLGSAGLAEIRMIQAALARLREGTFGTCVACGEPISSERLDILPHTPRCKDCA